MIDQHAQLNLPCNLDAERLVLGSILLDHSRFAIVAGTLNAESFSLEKHRRIWRCMEGINNRGEPIDSITVAHELKRRHELESVDGLGYLVSLDDGLPHVVNLESYVRIVDETAVLRQTIFAAQSLINRCVNASSAPHEILAEAEAVLAKISQASGKRSQWIKPGEVMQSYPGGINAFMEPPRGGAGVATPWPGLTKVLCGLHRGDLFLVAGRPSMGKSIVGMALAHGAALHGEGVAVLSLEMSKDSLVRRLISAIGGVDAQRLRSGCLDREERRRALEAASQIDAIPLWIDDSGACTLPAVNSALRKLAAHHSVRLVIIDHLQLMKGVSRAENRHHELSEISHSFKHLAVQMDVTVILLSQLNRECEKAGRRPQLSDLKETGSLEEDADVVLFVHRPEQFDRQDPTLRGKAEFIIAKQRNGPTGKRNMLFQHEHQRFVETVEPVGGDL